MKIESRNTADAVEQTRAFLCNNWKKIVKFQEKHYIYEKQ